MCSVRRSTQLQPSHTKTPHQTLSHKRTEHWVVVFLPERLPCVLEYHLHYPQLQLQGPCSTPYNGTLAPLLYWEGQEVLERILHFPKTTPTVITESSFVKVALALGRQFYFLPTNGTHKQWVAPWNPRWKGPDRRQHMNQHSDYPVQCNCVINIRAVSVTTSSMLIQTLCYFSGILG